MLYLQQYVMLPYCSPLIYDKHNHNTSYINVQHTNITHMRLRVQYKYIQASFKYRKKKAKKKNSLATDTTVLSHPQPINKHFILLLSFFLLIFVSLDHLFQLLLALALVVQVLMILEKGKIVCIVNIPI